MMNDDKFSRVWGDPIYFKTLPIYPVRMRNIQHFYNCTACLMLDKVKNQSKEIEIIKMNYLTFMLFIAKQDGYEYLFEGFIDMLKMVFNVDDIAIGINETERGYTLTINDVTISGIDFDKIRKIIAEQNLLDIDDTLRSAEVEKKIMETREY
ncbi:hypothetical protein ACFVRU_47735, partial [Streptomyces sp. NPDC057927]